MEIEQESGVGQRRGDNGLKSLHGMVTLLVPEYNYGIIKTSAGVEVYFLRANVLAGAFDQLTVGGKVRFDRKMNLLGPQALHVQLLHKKPKDIPPLSTQSFRQG